jgi:uncharacterized protein YdeI (YjbR/CyaY-like superfamily)
MTPTFFATQDDFRNWLENNHLIIKELIVGFYKVGTGKPSMTWSQSVDQALCFGWIDGVRRTVDENSYCIRFTPRRKTSIWSAINVKKVEELTKAGLMKAEGLKAFSLLDEKKSLIYSHETQIAVLDSSLENQFKSNVSAWGFFNNQAPSYKKVTIHWIMSAKQEKTRISRLEKVILVSEEGKRLS